MLLLTQLFKLLSIPVVITASACQTFAQIPTSSSLPSQSQPSIQSSKMSNAVNFEVFNVGSSPLAEGFQPAPNVFVFRQKQAWSQFWQSSSILDMNLQKRPAPAVNFADKMVIALTSGSKPTGGYSIRIDRIEQVPSSQGNRWLIHYTETVPEKNCIVTQQPTTPTVFILTEKSNASVVLRGQKQTSDCSK
jgi:hypothetical protein